MTKSIKIIYKRYSKKIYDVQLYGQYFQQYINIKKMFVLQLFGFLFIISRSTFMINIYYVNDCCPICCEMDGWLHKNRWFNWNVIN